MVRRYFVVIMLVCVRLISIQAQSLTDSDVGMSFPQAHLTKPHYYHDLLPAGNYSGITWLGGDKYLMVSDQGAKDALYSLTIKIDSSTGELLRVACDSVISLPTSGMDLEGVAYLPDSSTVLVSSEAANRVIEYTLDGMATGKELAVPGWLQNTYKNFGLESLTYDRKRQKIWTVTECSLPCDDALKVSSQKLRLMAFNRQFMPIEAYLYTTDTPRKSEKGMMHVMGVSELTALDDGTILVLEREFFVPKTKLGAYVVCKLYGVRPTASMNILSRCTGRKLNADIPSLPKHLLCEWKTRMNLLHQDLANYEGMCLGPRLADGRQVLVLCADSQNQYGGMLRDWLMTIVLENPK